MWFQSTGIEAKVRREVSASMIRTTTQDTVVPMIMTDIRGIRIRGHLMADVHLHQHEEGYTIIIKLHSL